MHPNNHPYNWRTLNNPPAPAWRVKAQPMQIDTQAIGDKPRGARLEARISLAQKARLQRAAALSGRTLSEFVLASAQEAADRVIASHDSIQLSRDEQQAFVAALLNPPAPSPRLQQAAALFRKQMGL